jgi:DMSO/TMAO reductase YedYZ molybdopterin-dependent catalytic subunit
MTDFITRGFRGKRRSPNADRLPPGQYETKDFPVLSAGPTPRIPLEEWRFGIEGAVKTPTSWTWTEFMALPNERITVDIHCVTKWSKFDTVWRGVAIDTLLDIVQPTNAAFVTASSYGGYTTNVPLDHLTKGQAWVAYEFDNEPLDPVHGGPARLLVPHLYFWKSAKWVNGLELREHDQSGFWEVNGYHDLGDPWKEQRYQGD